MSIFGTRFVIYQVMHLFESFWIMNPWQEAPLSSLFYLQKAESQAWLQIAVKIDISGDISFHKDLHGDRLGLSTMAMQTLWSIFIDRCIKMITNGSTSVNEGSLDLNCRELWTGLYWPLHLFQRYHWIEIIIQVNCETLSQVILATWGKWSFR